MSKTARAGRKPAYTTDAASYDQRTAVHDTYRRMSVAALGLRRGDTVIDAGCGTGLCFAALQDRIGPEGTIVAVDASAEMLACARRRVAEQGWTNVVIIESAVEKAELPTCDHALFCAVHDVLQSPAALDNVLAHVRPSGTVTAVGGKWGPSWAVALNAAVLALHSPYIEDFTGFDRPWALLRERLPGLIVREIAMGGGFLATGRV